MTQREPHKDDGFIYIKAKEMKRLLEAMQALIYWLEKEHGAKHIASKCKQCWSISEARKLIRGEE